MENNRNFLALYFYLIIVFLLLTNIDKLSGQEIKDNSIKLSSVSPGFSPLQHLYDVKFYFIDLEVDNTSTYIAGKTGILVESIVPVLDTLIFELDSAMHVDSVKVNYIQTEFFTENNLLIIILQNPLNAIKLLSVDVYYKGTGGRQNFYGGIMTRKDFYYNKSVTYTMSEPFQAMTWFPCKQDLTDKADSAWIFITLKKGLKAGANGLLEEITVNDSTVRYEWKTKYPVPCYLLSFSVSDYQDYSFYTSVPGLNDSIPVINYVYNHPSLLENEKDHIDKTDELLKLFSELIGVYPFYKEKYGHCMAPMGGGMEHQTMTTLSSFNFSLVAHELAHQWFGNYVTCNSWQDIWINEGFASYLEYVAIEKLKTQEEAQMWMINAQTGAKKHERGSVFISNDDFHNINRIFNTDLTYKKGATILHMLRYEINNDNIFFNVLKEFLQEFAFKSAGANDFIKTLNRITKNDFTWFFDQWYYGEGFPIFFTSWKQEGDLLTITGKQETSSTKTPFFKTHMDYKIIYNDNSEEIIRVLFDSNYNEFRVKTKKAVTEIISDPGNYILKSSVLQENSPLETALFSISPNPFISDLCIKFKTGLKQRTIFLTAPDGNKIFETSCITENNYLDLSFLPEGHYLLTIIEDKKEYSFKVSKQ